MRTKKHKLEPLLNIPGLEESPNLETAREVKQSSKAVTPEGIVNPRGNGGDLHAVWHSRAQGNQTSHSDHRSSRLAPP